MNVLQFFNAIYEKYKHLKRQFGRLKKTELLRLAL